MSALTRRVVGVSAAMAAVILLATLTLTAIAQAQTTPTITSVTVSDITMTSATVTVNLADAPDETTVYLKYGPLNHYSTRPRPPAYNIDLNQNAPSGLLDPPDGINPRPTPPLEEDSVSGAATFDIPKVGQSGLWASYEVKAEASLVEDFSSGVAIETFMTLPPKAEGDWVDAEKTAMGILAWLSHLSGVPQVIYYRWRAEAAATWNTGTMTLPWGNPQDTSHQVMTGLVSHTPYVMEVSLDPTFPTDETFKETGWTREPDVVRMGIRKVTETEATVTAVMDHPNGKDYGLGCQYNPDAYDEWSYIRHEDAMVSFVGSTLLQSLTEDEDYQYRCRLSFDHGEFGTYTTTRALSSKSLRTLGTDTALAEISGTLSGTSATITVDLANTDTTNNDVYLRHREYPSEEWSAESTKDTTTATAQWTTTLTDDTVHEFEASLDQDFPEAETLTLYLTVGNPPYTTVSNSGSSTPIENPNNGGGTENPNNGGNTPPEETNTEETNNNGGTLPQNNGGGGGRSGGGGGGFGGGSVTRNSPPIFRDSARDMRTVPENSEEGVKVGEPIVAWDPQNDVLAFSLRGDDAEPFTIDEETGQILVGPEAVLDYEAQDVHVVTLVVTDPGGEETTTELEIHLTDIKLPGKADIFDVANNHNERLEREEVEAAAAAYGLGLMTKLEILFIVKYYYTTELAVIDFANLPSMVDKYDLNEDSIIDRDEVLTALQDFMEGRLSRSDMREVLKVYYTTIEAEAQEAEPAQT